MYQKISFSLNKALTKNSLDGTIDIIFPFFSSLTPHFEQICQLATLQKIINIDRIDKQTGAQNSMGLPQPRSTSPKI